MVGLLEYLVGLVEKKEAYGKGRGRGRAPQVSRSWRRATVGGRVETSEGDAALMATLLVKVWEYTVGFLEAGLLRSRDHR